MIYIVGNGLFGAVTRDLLRKRGIECETIDCGKSLSGSWPAGCLMKPSWLSKVKGRDAALELLDELYGLKTIPLAVGGSLQHVDPELILRPPDIWGAVRSVLPDVGEVIMEDGRVYCGKVLVAAGIWSKALLPAHFRDVPLVGLQGVSFRLQGGMPAARLHVWAPFKQAIAFEIASDVTWFGDGTSILRENFGDEHITRARERLPSLGLSPGAITDVRVGIRPAVKGQVGWFRRVGANCWVSTGGAKNGVVLAAAQALQFVKDAT